MMVKKGFLNWLSIEMKIGMKERPSKSKVKKNIFMTRTTWIKREKDRRTDRQIDREKDRLNIEPDRHTDE
jgi:hypothetical protein